MDPDIPVFANLILLLFLLFSTAWTKELPKCGVRVAEQGVCFEEYPGDGIVGEGERVDLDCRVLDSHGDSLPPRALFWLLNGTAIPDATGPRLSLFDMGWNSSGMYQCASKERGGVVLSPPGQLRLRQAPQWTSQPKSQSVPPGKTARFHCAVHAVPRATIEWRRGNRTLRDDLKHSRWRMLNSGTLQIYRTRPSDAGNYLCIASNSAGNSTSQTATLSLRQEMAKEAKPTKISQVEILIRPRNASVLQGEDALFECLINGFAPDEIIWERLGGKQIAPGRTELVGSNLKIRAVEPWDEGFYGCRAKTATKYASSQPFPLKAYLSVLNPPVIREFPAAYKLRMGQHARFHCVADSKEIPEIVWYKNGEEIQNGGTIKLFPEMDQPPSQQITPQHTIQYSRALKVDFMLEEHVGMYQCFVKNSQGLASAASRLEFTPGNLTKDQAPQNLQAQISSDAKKPVSLRWDAPAGIPLKDISVYILYYFEAPLGKKANTEASPCLGETCSMECCDATELRPHTNYTFWVTSLLSDGTYTHPSTSVQILTPDGVATSVAPLTVTGQSGGEVRLDWEEPDQETAPGYIEAYRIEYRKALPDAKPTQYEVPHVITSRQFKRGALGSGSAFAFRVIPKTTAGYPPKTDLTDEMFPWTYHTVQDKDQMMLPVAPHLEAEPLNSSTILVKISPGGHSAIKGFRISCTLQTENKAPARNRTVPANTTTLYINKLAPESLYEIKAAAISESGELSSLEASHTVRTKKQPITVPVIVIVEPADVIWCDLDEERRLMIRWEKPTSGRDIVRYRVRFSPVPEQGSPLNASQVQYFDVGKTEFLPEDLQDGESYLFAVQSWDKHNYTGPFSGDFTCKNPGNSESPLQVPEAPVDLVGREVNATAVEVSWRTGEGSPTSLPLSDLMYTVYYADSLDAGAWSVINVNGSLSVVIGNLSSDSHELHFKVTGSNAAGAGKPSDVVYVPRLGSLTFSPPPSPSTSPTPPPTTTNIVVVSYKEGIIVGSCIAVVCVFLCLLILCNRNKIDLLRRGEVVRNSTQSNGPKPPVPPPVWQGPCVELTEMQTLLPPYLDNSHCDSKGADDSAQRPGRLPGSMTRDRFLGRERKGSGMMNGTNGQRVVQESHLDGNLPGEELAVRVVSADVRRESEGEAGKGEGHDGSSDLSHSPVATGSSLHSGSHEDCGDSSTGSGPDMGMGGEGGGESTESPDWSVSCQSANGRRSLKGRSLSSGLLTPPHHLGDSGIGFDCYDHHHHHRILPSHAHHPLEEDLAHRLWLNGHADHRHPLLSAALHPTFVPPPPRDNGTIHHPERPERVT